MVIADKKILIAIVAGVLLAGCVNFRANYLLPIYGEVAADTDRSDLMGRSVVMDPNAPSISQGFMPEPVLVYKRDNPTVHNGIDIVAERGTPILAPAPGIVVRSFFEPVYGNQIRITHQPDRDGTDYRTNYYHLKKRLVKAGDVVERGQTIGLLGSTGLLAAFKHLHFEVRSRRRDGQWLARNPHAYWAAGKGIVTCFGSDIETANSEFLLTYPVLCRK